MNQLIKIQNDENGDILVSGRELHEFLEVKTAYKDWFPRMCEYGFEEFKDFCSILSESTGGRPSQDHHMKIDMAKEIAMIQRTDKGKQARQYFLELERRWNSPEMIIKRAMDLQQEKILRLENQIQQDKLYTDFGKVVEISNGSINIGAYSKLIYDQYGVKIGRNRLLEWLREKGYLIKGGREKNHPKQEYIEQGLFELKPTIIKRTEGDVQGGTPMITGKGQLRIWERLKMELEGA